MINLHYLIVTNTLDISELKSTKLKIVQLRKVNNHYKVEYILGKKRRLYK